MRLEGPVTPFPGPSPGKAPGNPIPADSLLYCLDCPERQACFPYLTALRGKPNPESLTGRPGDAERPCELPSHFAQAGFYTPGGRQTLGEMNGLVLGLPVTCGRGPGLPKKKPDR